VPRRSRIRGWRFLLVAALSSSAIVACSPDGPVALQTTHNAGAACDLRGVRGELFYDPTWGLALMGTDASGAPHRYGVVWSDVYSARREGGTVVLFESGKAVAREGDQVDLLSVRRDPLVVCDVEVVET
jgi:hypothetical protein